MKIRDVRGEGFFCEACAGSMVRSRAKAIVPACWTNRPQGSRSRSRTLPPYSVGFACDEHKDMLLDDPAHALASALAVLDG